MKTLRVIGQTRYEDRGYSNEESIAYLQLQKPEEINSFLTYNYGMDDDRFPLSFITEGQGSRGIKDVATRSEERRVGKECRSRWSPYH